MKREKLYVNKINKKISNNQNYCDINNNNYSQNIEDDELSIDEKLKKLFNTNGYVFNISVKIITNDKTYNTKIAGKVNNYIITLDNDVINIKDIKDIIF